MKLKSALICPSCHHQAIETMPTDACQFFYDCKGCGTRLKPLPGDCCVFCSLRLHSMSAYPRDGKGACRAEAASAGGVFRRVSPNGRLC